MSDPHNRGHGPGEYAYVTVAYGSVGYARPLERYLTDFNRFALWPSANLPSHALIMQASWTNRDEQRPQDRSGAQPLRLSQCVTDATGTVSLGLHPGSSSLAGQAVLVRSTEVRILARELNLGSNPCFRTLGSGQVRTRRSRRRVGPAFRPLDHHHCGRPSFNLLVELGTAAHLDA